MTPTAEIAPLYLGCDVDQWFADFLSSDYVEKMELPCQALVGRLPSDVRWDLGQAHAFKPENENVVCQALPCFERAFVHRALEALPHVDERKQVRLAFAIAKTGWTSLPYLMELLKHASPHVRAAVCLGVAEVVNPWEGDEAPAVLQRKIGFLCGPDLRSGEVDAVFEETEALQDSPEGKRPIPPVVPEALTQRLTDEYAAVRMAALFAIIELVKFCQIEFEKGKSLSAAVVDTMGDDRQAVRIEASRALTLLAGARAQLSATDSRLAAALENMINGECYVKAVDELIWNGVWESLRKVLDDPFPQVTETATHTLARCSTSHDLRALIPREISEMQLALKVADGEPPHMQARRHEAIWALEWLLSQWTLAGECESLPPASESHDKNATLRGAVPASLSRVRELAVAPIEEVLAVLHDRDIALRVAALDTLAGFGNRSPHVIPRVVGMCDDSCQQVRWKAYRAVCLLIKCKSGGGDRYGVD